MRAVSRSKWMAASLGFALVLGSGAQEAHGYGFEGFPDYDPHTIRAWSYVVLVLDGLTMGGGVVTGIGSSIHVERGTPHRKWFAASYVLGGLNLLVAGGWAAVSATDWDKPIAITLTVAHGAIGIWNLVVPSIGIHNGARPRVAPVPVGGLDSGGRLWAGAAVQISRF